MEVLAEVCATLVTSDLNDMPWVAGGSAVLMSLRAVGNMCEATWSVAEVGTYQQTKASLFFDMVEYCQSARYRRWVLGSFERQRVPNLESQEMIIGSYPPIIRQSLWGEPAVRYRAQEERTYQGLAGVVRKGKAKT